MAGRRKPSIARFYVGRSQARQSRTLMIWRPNSASSRAVDGTHLRRFCCARGVTSDERPGHRRQCCNQMGHRGRRDERSAGLAPPGSRRPRSAGCRMRQHSAEKSTPQRTLEPEAAFAAGLLARADVELVAMRPYLEAATRIAAGLDHPAYDCFYIALAEAEGLSLVTADSTLVRKASGRYAGRVLGLTDAATWSDES